MWPRLASCLSLPGSGITGMSHHSQPECFFYIAVWSKHPLPSGPLASSHLSVTSALLGTWRESRPSHLPVLTLSIHEVHGGLCLLRTATEISPLILGSFTLVWPVLYGRGYAGPSLAPLPSMCSSITYIGHGGTPLW